MKCPSCQTELKIADRHGVEIDYCGSCRGVWLDRGELDKIIERASGSYGSREMDDDDDDDHRRNAPPVPGTRASHQHTNRKRSWLGEMFDFGD